MGRIAAHLDFSYSRRYASNFWTRHAARDGRWSMSVAAAEDDREGPEAARPALVPPHTPVLPAVAALRIPRAALTREPEAVGARN